MLRSEMVAKTRKKFIPNSFESDHGLIDKPSVTVAKAKWPVVMTGVALIAAGALLGTYFFRRSE